MSVQSENIRSRYPFPVNEMFGYVKPYIPDLKVIEYEQFKACYCGLCTALKREYGFRARFIHNYDFTFLAMLFSEMTSCSSLDKCRCIASLLKKKNCICCDSGFDIAAGLCVILTKHKLDDSVKDDHGFK